MRLDASASTGALVVVLDVDAVVLEAAVPVDELLETLGGTALTKP